MLLRDIVKPDRIKTPLEAATKQGAIEELIDVLAAAGCVQDRDRALPAVLERERTRTTGIGDGLAIPHGKTPAVPEVVMAIGKTPRGIDFDSIDGRPVTLVVLLLSPPDRTGAHIQALARISRLMGDASFRGKLEKAATAEEVFQVVREQEPSRA